MPLHEKLLFLPPYRKAYAQFVLGWIKSFGRVLVSESDQQLRDRALDLRFRAKSGETPEKLTAEAFALVQEASRRVLGKKHYDVQLLAGIHLASKCVVEMATGEGKTLTAMLPLYLYCLSGKGAHLATANDYLAKRDSETTRPVLSISGFQSASCRMEIPTRSVFPPMPAMSPMERAFNSASISCAIG